MVDDCRLLASQIQFSHYLREVNRSADKLARMGEKEIILFESSLVDIANVLEFDLAGLCMHETLFVTWSLFNANPFNPKK